MEVLPHFSHVHPLVFNDGRSHESEEVYCCACGELVSGPRFSCVDCGFHLDKNCAEAPVEMNHPFHRQHNLKLMTSSPYVEGHEHLLLLYITYLGGYCNACGGSIGGYKVYRCKACYFNVHYGCLTSLPQTTWHKSDRHCLILTYHEDNDYSQYHYCDVCEKERSPNTWFYHCPICDNSAHLSCVLRGSQFLKRGIKIKESDHPHTLMIVEKVYDYPECHKCGHRCMDLALECLDAECKYIIHWECSTTFQYIRSA
ncbi:hypothetical protein ES319_D10G256100v1 [Gossypium barbadense]|uniref:Phorbol-ester/DAG-type domain-containing protein n=1 Tax=Gossypium barbadense TaxID=3634 RepID=A0A5J5PVK3_GOSBA|nr:hypothetical protein ES319_D10G256100v1 [Gossypium barbadense]